MFGFYTRHFDTTESNYSFRRVPSAKTIATWSEKSPEGFAFSLKAPQRITHFAKLRDCAEPVAFFWNVIRPLDRKLGAVLFQLPPGLHRDLSLLEDFLAARPSGMRAAFEFRHESWFDGGTLDLLAREGAALCVAESAELTTPRATTAKFGYLRLRREDYTPRDLEQWATWVQDQPWDEAFVYFKHEETAAGPKFATAFRELIQPRQSARESGSSPAGRSNKKQGE